MKLTFARMSLFAFILMSSIVFSGCKKFIDQIDHPQYRIQKITTGISDGDSVTYDFSYNSNRDPVTVKNSYLTTGNPNMFFVYDRNHRLTQLVRPYDNGFYESWHKYGYNSAGEIVRDTMYENGLFIDSIAQPAAEFQTYSNYSYDAQGRITRKIDSIFYFNVFFSADTATFAYNAAGNQIREGITYDNKVSVLSTNKVWMFICNDFSVNNPFTATSYNSYGLPLNFPAIMNDNNLAPIIPQPYPGRIEYARQ